MVNQIAVLAMVSNCEFLFYSWWQHFLQSVMNLTGTILCIPMWVSSPTVKVSSLTVSFVTDCKFLQLVTIAGTAIWLTITLGGIWKEVGGGANENIAQGLGYPISIPQYFHWSHDLPGDTPSISNNTFTGPMSFPQSTPSPSHNTSTGHRFLSRGYSSHNRMGYPPPSWSSSWSDHEGTSHPEEDGVPPVQDRMGYPHPGQDRMGYPSSGQDGYPPG